MATQTIKMMIQIRRDTAANWELHKDEIPAAGEPCFVLDKNILKIGDGITTFENLEPINGVKFEIAADGKSLILDNNTLKLMGYEGAEVGAQPVKTEDGIKWVVPSTETVEGLKTTVADLQSEVSDLKSIVGSADDGAGTLLSRIEGLETKMDGTGEGTVDAKIDAKINEFATRVTDDGIINNIQELFNYVANHGSEVDTLVNDITTLQGLVGSEPVAEQITTAIANSGHMSKAEAEDTLLSKVEAKEAYKQVKYEIDDTPAGTLVDYRDKEIRIMVPANAVWTKQQVGAGGDVNNYYMTFKTYAPDNAVGYIEHLGDQSDEEILTSFSTDKYGRRYQPTWLALAKYDETSDSWIYYGKASSAKKYIGWDYQIDWYDVNGVIIESDKIRINLSNEACHNVIEPYYMANVVKGVAVNGTLLDVIDGRVDITVPEFKSSDEIEVAEDGTLSIKSISFDKIVQDEDTIVVMDGGSAV